MSPVVGLIKGSIVAVIADNLGAAAIGGFKEGSTAAHGCRQCMCTPEEFAEEAIYHDK